jgi:hypothetical protein
VGPGSGARRTATPPGYAPNADGCRHVRIAPSRPAETLPMPAETNTSHTDKRCRKTLQEHPRSCKVSGAKPAGALARPHGTAQQPGEERPISKRQPLRVPNGQHRRGSRATVGDSHEGPLITRGKPFLLRKSNKMQMNPQTANHTPHSRGLVQRRAHSRNKLSSPSSGQPRHPSGELPSRSRAKRRTTKALPRSRAPCPLG